jgi:8-oxo-dGTP pyrophosphatase MutT (NUDIX family)
MPREKSAGAIIFTKESGKIFYLLLHYPGINRKGGHWEFAKGHIEEGENYEQTVKREVAEETGLKDVKIMPGFKEHIKYFFRQYKKNVVASEKSKKQTSWIFKLVTFFIAEAGTKDVKLSAEHIGFAWLPFDEAIKKVTYKNSRELLKKANEFILSIK